MSRRDRERLADVVAAAAAIGTSTPRTRFSIGRASSADLREPDQMGPVSQRLNRGRHLDGTHSGKCSKVAP